MQAGTSQSLSRMPTFPASDYQRFGSAPQAHLAGWPWRSVALGGRCHPESVFNGKIGKAIAHLRADKSKVWSKHPRKRWQRAIGMPADGIAPHHRETA